MQVNIDLLRKKIAQSDMAIEKTASSIGIDASTFYRKLKANGETFTVKEMFSIIEVLDINKHEADNIFFGYKLS